MGRTKSPMSTDLNAEVPLSDDLNISLNTMAQHRVEIMQQFGDGLPYERDRIVHEARFYMAQSAEAMLEAGKRLIILKENEPHGDFINIVESELSMSKRTAQVMMQASINVSAIINLLRIFPSEHFSQRAIVDLETLCM